MPSPLLFPRCLLTSPGGEAADVVARDVKTPVTSLVGGLGARLVGSRSFDKAPARFVSATPPTQHPSHHSHLQSRPQCFALPSPALSAPPRLPARSATLSASWLLATLDPSVLAARRLPTPSASARPLKRSSTSARRRRGSCWRSRRSSRSSASTLTSSTGTSTTSRRTRVPRETSGNNWL